MTVLNLPPWERHVYNFANNAHAGQTDDGGENYFKSHVLHVVHFVKQVTDDPIMITAAYLHDVIEDTDMTYQDIKDHFLDPVADWVMELTHEGSKKEGGYYFPRLKTKQCIIIKFCDRLSNLSRMIPWSEGRQQAYLDRSIFWKTISPNVSSKFPTFDVEYDFSTLYPDKLYGIYLTELNGETTFIPESDDIFQIITDKISQVGSIVGKPSDNKNCDHKDKWSYPRSDKFQSGRFCTGCGKLEPTPDWVTSDDDYYRWKISKKEEHND